MAGRGCSVAGGARPSAQRRHASDGGTVATSTVTPGGPGPAPPDHDSIMMMAAAVQVSHRAQAALSTVSGPGWQRNTAASAASDDSLSSANTLLIIPNYS